MAFKRTYAVPDADDLYVTVLVKCTNCGAKDVLESVNNIEYVDGQFHNDTSIDVHDDCPICESNDWEERAEHISIGIPTDLQGKSYTFETIDSMVTGTNEFLSKLEVAREEDFRVRDVLSDEGMIILWKD